jgi:hypothetical protein
MSSSSKWGRGGRYSARRITEAARSSGVIDSAPPELGPCAQAQHGQHDIACISLDSFSEHVDAAMHQVESCNTNKIKVMMLRMQLQK